jgi:putative transposase
MRTKRFSAEQMIGVLKQAEVGVPVAEVIRKAGISEQTFYRWKYAGLEVDRFVRWHRCRRRSCG